MPNQQAIAFKILSIINLLLLASWISTQGLTLPSFFTERYLPVSTPGKTTLQTDPFLWKNELFSLLTPKFRSFVCIVGRVKNTLYENCIARRSCCCISLYEKDDPLFKKNTFDGISDSLVTRNVLCENERLARRSRKGDGHHFGLFYISRGCNRYFFIAFEFCNK